MPPFNAASSFYNTKVLLLYNFEIEKYYQNKAKSNDVYSINNLSKIKDGAYVTNIDEYESIGTEYVNAENVVYFDSYGVERVPKGIKNVIGNKNIITNIYRIKAHDSIMCG